jgi:hypothetical protein
MTYSDMGPPTQILNPQSIVGAGPVPARTSIPRGMKVAH